MLFSSSDLLTDTIEAIRRGILEPIDQFIKRERNIDRLFCLSDTEGSLLYLAASEGQKSIVRRLLEAQADVNLKARDGTSPLCAAARNGHHQVVKTLINAQADLDSETKSGATALHIASMRGHDEVVRLLIKAQACLNVQQMHGATSLYIAVQESNRTVIESLLAAGACVNIKIKSGEGPLHYASQCNLSWVVEKLLGAHADANICQDEGASPLLIVSQLGHYGMAEKLLSAMADPIVKSTAGYTALHLAAQNGHYRIVKMLMEATSGTQGHWDWTDGYLPLYMAAQNGHTRIVQEFVAAQFNLNMQTKFGATPLYIAAGKGHKRVVELLLSAQADVDVKRRMSDSPLYIASQLNNHEVVRSLIKCQADLSTRFSNGFTPLHIAAQEGHQKVADALIEACADPNVTDASGFPPLFYAAQNGHRNVVNALICQARADVNLQGTNGESALHAASQMGHHGIVQSLIKAQCDPDMQQLHGCTAIYLAVQNGHGKAVDALIAAQANADIQPPKCSSPLYSAIFKNHREIVEKLILKSRVDVDQKRIDGIGDSPLHVAVMSHNRHWATRILLNAQAEVNVQTDRACWSPLHLASHTGSLEAVIALIAAQADVDLLARDGESPMSLAIKQGRDQVIEALKKATAADNRISTSPTDGFETNSEFSAESFTQEPDRLSLSESELSQRLHCNLVRSGFIRSRATLQSAVSDVLLQILRERGVRLTGEYTFIVGSYSEGWGNSLTCTDGRPDVESDIDMMQLLAGRKYHLKGCECEAVPQSEYVVEYDNGHIVCSGFASSPARASVGSILAQRPAIDEVSACRLCSYPPVSPLQSARIAASKLPEQTVLSLQTVLKLSDWPCHVVHAAPPGQAGEQLRVSTTFLENRLLRSLSTVQGQVFVTLKYLVKKVISRRVSGIKAYHAKTLVFRLLEETPPEQWQPDQLVALTRRALQMLLDGLKRSSSTPDGRVLDHYFLNDAGLYLKGSDRSSIESIASVLENTIFQLPKLLLQFESSLRPVEPETGFCFHPFLLLPQLYPHQTPTLSATEVEYHQIYDVVCESMLQLSSSDSNPEFLARLLSRLPERAAYSAREALRAVASLKFGFVGTAQRILRNSLGHRTGCGIPWPPTSDANGQPDPDSEATAEYVWKHLIGSDFAFKICLRFDARPELDFLPKFSRAVFPTWLKQTSVTDYYVNFDALLRCLQFELLPAETAASPGAMAWFVQIAQRRNGDADLQEVLTAMHFCPDIELVHQLASKHSKILEEAMSAGYREAATEWDRFQQMSQAAAVLADKFTAELISD